jgi:hypothetical protein
METECRSIERNALRLAWYMRGGILYEDVLNMSPQQREEIGNIIDENMETTKKTGLSFF